MTATINDNDRINRAMLDFLQQPPVGDGVPFTADELAAIATYNAAMYGVIDCLDIKVRDTAHGVMHTIPHQQQQDEDSLASALSDVTANFETLRAWYEALDQLHDDTAHYPGNMPTHTGNVERLLRWEADRLISAAEQLRRAVAIWLVGYGGPHIEHGRLAMSTGWIDSTCMHS